MLLDIVSLLKAEPKFFEHSEKDRKGVVEKMGFSSFINEYLLKAKKETFLSDSEEVVRSLISSPLKANRVVGLSLLDFVSNYFDHDTELDLNTLVNEEFDHFILVQSPMKLESKMKEEIKESLVKKYPNSSPVFVVNKSLIGGLRIYVDGKTEDLSWVSKINILTSLNKI